MNPYPQTRRRRGALRRRAGLQCVIRQGYKCESNESEMRKFVRVWFNVSQSAAIHMLIAELMRSPIICQHSFPCARDEKYGTQCQAVWSREGGEGGGWGRHSQLGCRRSSVGQMRLWELTIVFWQSFKYRKNNTNIIAGCYINISIIHRTLKSPIGTSTPSLNDGLSQADHCLFFRNLK